MCECEVLTPVCTHMMYSTMKKKVYEAVYLYSAVLYTFPLVILRKGNNKKKKREKDAFSTNDLNQVKAI